MVEPTSVIRDPKYTTFNPERIAKKSLILNDENENLNHRVLRLSAEEEAIEEIESNLITISTVHNSASAISKSMKKEGIITNLKLNEISSPKFMLTFSSKKEKD